MPPPTDSRAAVALAVVNQAATLYGVYAWPAPGQFSSEERLGAISAVAARLGELAARELGDPAGAMSLVSQAVMQGIVAVPGTVRQGTGTLAPAPDAYRVPAPLYHAGPGAVEP